MSAQPKMIGEPVPDVLQRPRCPMCGKRLRPLLHTMTGTKQSPTTEYRLVPGPTGLRSVQQFTGKSETVPDFNNATREWRGEWHAYGAFCTLRCGTEFANAAHRAGYRITKGKP